PCPLLGSTQNSRSRRRHPPSPTPLRRGTPKSGFESVQEMPTNIGANRAAPAIARVELVVVAERVFTIAPAQPHEPALDTPEEVHETNLRIFDDAAERTDALPAALVTPNALAELVLETAHVGHVGTRRFERLGSAPDALCELGQPLLDLALFVELLSDDQIQRRNQRVDFGNGEHRRTFREIDASQRRRSQSTVAAGGRSPASSMVRHSLQLSGKRWVSVQFSHGLMARRAATRSSRSRSSKRMRSDTCCARDSSSSTSSRAAERPEAFRCLTSKRLRISSNEKPACRSSLA